MQIKNCPVFLNDTINDYAEEKLSPNEQRLLKDYISSDKQLREFVYRSKQGKRALNQAYHVVAADDFGEKLARRIAREEKKDQKTI